MAEAEDQINTFLNYCLRLLRDPKVASKLTSKLTAYMKEQGEETTIAAPLPERDVFQVSKQRDIGREFKMTAELAGYDMDGVMLDLGSDVNILHKKSWEVMGKPKLVWSPIQLRLANHYKIYPIGRLEQVEVNIGVKTKADFEVNQIMDESDPYPALLGINWAFDNNVVLNLKKSQMSFETDTMRVVAPLDPYESNRYNEPVNEEVQSSAIENIYKVTGHREDYINPTANRELSWRSVNSYDTNYENALDRWQNKLY
jgi:hypothetical protein